MENKVIPLMREGIHIVEMIFYRKLKKHLGQKNPGNDSVHVSRLAGAVINELFGTPNLEETFAAFAAENRSSIDEEMRNIASLFPEMRIPLTDALRIQVLCDYQEGIDSSAVLQNARDLGVLMVDREIPLPAPFMAMVRKLGGAFGILLPMDAVNREI